MDDATYKPPVFTTDSPKVLRSSQRNSSATHNSANSATHSPDEDEEKRILRESELVDNASRAALQSTWLPIAVTVIMCAGAILFGWHVGFSSPAGASVQAKLRVSDKSMDFMWASLNIGALCGALLAGKIANLLGRRKATLIDCTPFIIAAVIMALTTSYAGWIVGRLLAGAAVGASSVLVPLYIAEVSPPHLRGALGACNQLCIAGGILLVNVVGLPTVDHANYYKILVLASIAFAALMFFGTLFVSPETPRWLVDNSRVDEAEATLRRLRGPRVDVSTELSQLQRTVNEDSAHDPEAQVIKPTMLESLTSISNRRQIIVALVVIAAQQLSGINGVIFNSASLFKGDKGDGPETESDARKGIMGAVYVNIVQVVCTAVSVRLMDRAGRRFFLLMSGMGLAVSSLLMGIIYASDGSDVLKIVAIMGYLAFFSFGLGPIPWLLVAEIFGPDVRGAFVALGTGVNWTLSFCVTVSFSSLRDGVGDDGLFFLYAGITAAFTTAIYFLVPETKGKSLSEVQELFDSINTGGLSASEAARVSVDERTTLL